MEANSKLVEIGTTFYGTTEAGGKSGPDGAGTVFSVTPSGDEKIVHSFGVRGDGQRPSGGLIDINGTLYGTTVDGGKYGKGTVFSVTPRGTERVVHSFGKAGDGANPFSGLVDVGGVLYGTTAFGGKHNTTARCTASRRAGLRKPCTLSPTVPTAGSRTGD